MNMKHDILIIGKSWEENAALRQILADEYNLSETSSISDTLKALTNTPPELILYHPAASDCDRRELFAVLNGDPVFSQIPVIVNANLADNDEIADLASSAHDIYIGPLHPEVIKKRLHLNLELLELRRSQKKMGAGGPISGIVSREHLEMMLKREWKRAMRHQAPQSLIIADVDFFKSYIEQYGMEAADECLRKIAVALADCVKRETDCIAHYQDDEFVCLLSETDILGAVRVANVMSEAVENLDLPHQGSPVADHVTMSFGVASLKPTAKVTPQKLISMADALLIEAKQKGYNQISSMKS